MENLKKKMNNENKSSKKKYCVPQLKRIGKINESTMGSPVGATADSFTGAQS